MLQSSSDVRRIADGRVVAAQVVADLSHDDRTGVQPHAQLQASGLASFAESTLHPQR
jgi:hypothetical protein